MGIQDLAEHKIGILGFGQEGQAVLSYLHKHSLTATVFDETPEQEWPEQTKQRAKKLDAKIFSGPECFDKIIDRTLLFRSPGIWRNHPQILKAESNGCIITSQVKWFFENSSAQIIGVTGTKGKGTTSSLIHRGLQAANKPSFLTGNIGKQQPLEFLDELVDSDIVVYELSSFQLQDLTISPHIGICLMVTSDHLNHHSDLAEYHGAKAAISAFQTEKDLTIYNMDYAASEQIGNLGKGRKAAISAKIAPESGAFPGAVIEEETIVVNLPGEPETRIETRIDCSHRKLRGKHNLENIAAATLALLETGVDPQTIITTINDFSGLEHRLQFVGIYNGVSFYNDSISTVPDTTIAAIRSFAEDEPIHLFLGGSEKGLTYENLIEELKNQTHVASITLLGETGAIIKTEIEKAGINIPMAGPYTDFTAAFDHTIELTKSGDVVLLSPAAASFDMFKNYAERGHQFINLAQKLKK